MRPPELLDALPLDPLLLDALPLDPLLLDALPLDPLLEPPLPPLELLLLEPVQWPPAQVWPSAQSLSVSQLMPFEPVEPLHAWRQAWRGPGIDCPANSASSSLQDAASTHSP
jgi:hypothetical protein